MAHYSVAKSKDNLSRLIDEALAGQEVIITRHGKPTVTLRAIDDAQPKLTNAQWLVRLRELRETSPHMDVSFLDLKRQDEADGAL